MKKILLMLSAFIMLQYAAAAQTAKKTIHRRHHHTAHATMRKAATTRTQHNIKVTDNDDHAAYEGKKSHINDGVKHNQQRNMNYQNSGADLPPSSGNNSK